jgi:hypothetical protein
MQISVATKIVGGKKRDAATKSARGMARVRRAQRGSTALQPPMEQ